MAQQPGDDLDQSARLALLGDDVGTSGREGSWREAFPEIIGKSPALLRALESVYKVARTSSAVLISGESGTGKELVARAIHRLSPRSQRPFIAINCSAIPEDLLESELFGHEKGAFTGADRRRAGHFELADGGTIFLDEIGDMPLRLQVKLLRVLQERRYMPLGASDEKRADVRIIAATNLDMEEAVRKGQFRLDLFYRLNVLPIAMPSLRERQSDIMLLADYFLDLLNREHLTVDPCYFTSSAAQAMEGYSWPGNVRELHNVVERLVVMIGGGPITEGALPEALRLRAPGAQLPKQTSQPEIETLGSQSMQVPTAHTVRADPVRCPEEFGRLPDAGLDLVGYIMELENSLIAQALERTRNNKNQAAKLLGLNRTTLVERIKKRKLDNTFGAIPGTVAESTGETSSS